ncbi:uncharacterized protein DS421_14g458320 [Arachis hypogaea]|nr:uncharacterized protein DS421_14g458320 [Arachis hypogaea]
MPQPTQDTGHTGSNNILVVLPAPSITDHRSPPLTIVVRFSSFFGGSVSCFSSSERGLLLVTGK